MKKVFIGSQLDGIKFGAGPGCTFLYFLHYKNQEPDLMWLNIEVNKFIILPKNSGNLPKYNEKMDELDEEESIKRILEIRREEIVDISLGDTSPHLFITFKSGKVLFVNGYDKNFECWQAGDGEGYGGHEWLIVAVPGNEIAVWAPKDFQIT
ncbi:hypothetical protein [Peribacillus kribbensis]|uniref:hypothetical protein n=1 Tax=Peribacillus kribbensis TaxID=356658 RepID=UPI00068739F1|nr:hypothetical protein [Peribacillus kribbensis]